MSTKDGTLTMKDTSGYLKTRELVALAKEACHITKPNSEMTHDEIRIVIRWIGALTPDTGWINGEFVLGKIGTALMLFTTLAEFPQFYEEYGLSQYN